MFASALELFFFFTDALPSQKIASVSSYTDAILVITDALLWYTDFLLREPYKVIDIDWIATKLQPVNNQHSTTFHCQLLPTKKPLTKVTIISQISPVPWTRTTEFHRPFYKSTLHNHLQKQLPIWWGLSLHIDHSNNAYTSTCTDERYYPVKYTIFKLA